MVSTFTAPKARRVPTALPRGSLAGRWKSRSRKGKRWPSHRIPTDPTTSSYSTSTGNRVRLTRCTTAPRGQRGSERHHQKGGNGDCPSRPSVRLSSLGISAFRRRGSPPTIQTSWLYRVVRYPPHGTERAQDQPEVGLREVRLPAVRADRPCLPGCQKTAGDRGGLRRRTPVDGA